MDKNLLRHEALSLSESVADVLESMDDGSARWEGMTAAGWRRLSAPAALRAGHECYMHDVPQSLDQWEITCYSYCAQLSLLRRIQNHNA